MKRILMVLSVCALVIACQPKEDNSAKEAFEKNAATMKTAMENWVNKTPDYSLFADDFITLDTGYGATVDTLTLEQVKENDKWALENLEFKILNEINVLPGVNADTKAMDGSTRAYIDWEVTRTATDSTPARTGVLRLYHSYDFNEEGKIIYDQTYGDFSGIVQYLMAPPETEDDGDGASE